MTIYNETMSGGSLINGLASVMANYALLSENGLIVDGNFFYYAEFIENAYDGVNLNSQSLIFLIYSYQSQGGAVLNDQALVSLISSYQSQGGAVLNDQALVSLVFSYQSQGGAVLNDQALVSLIFSYQSQGGAVLNDQALVSLVSSYQSQDGSILNGQASVSQVSSYQSDDGVLVDGQAYGTHTFNVDQVILYAIDEQIIVDIGFYWSVGELPYYWYVLEGYVWPGDDTTCVGVTVSERQNFTQTVLARTPKECCEIFSRQDVNWQIVYIKKWTQPADPNLWNPNIQNCLIDVDYICPEFSVSTRALNKIGFVSKAIQIIQYTPVMGSNLKFSGGAETIIKSGATTPTTASFEYFGSGTSIVGGEAEAYSSFDRNYNIYLGFKTIVESDFIFGLGQALTIVPLTETVNTICGTCIAFPMELYIQNNFVKGGVLKNFLQRNGFVLPEMVKLMYSARYGSWIGSQHFQGSSYDNINQETWRFQYEFGCTNAPFSEEETTGNPVFKFSISIVQKNLGTNLTLDTRIVIIFSSDDVCNTVRNFKEDFIFDINTKTNFVSTPNGISPSTVILSDKIGIFLGSVWYNSPALNFRISASDVLVQGETKDITPIIPTEPLLYQLGEALVIGPPFTPAPPI